MLHRSIRLGADGAEIRMTVECTVDPDRLHVARACRSDADGPAPPPPPPGVLPQSRGEPPRGVTALRKDPRGERVLDVGGRELALSALRQLASGRGFYLVPQTSGAPQVVRAALRQPPITACRSLSLCSEFADVVEHPDAVVVEQCASSHGRASHTTSPAASTGLRSVGGRARETWAVRGRSTSKPTELRRAVTRTTGGLLAQLPCGFSSLGIGPDVTGPIRVHYRGDRI